VPILVANGAQIMCDMGASPSVLAVIPGPPHIATAAPPPAPLATITDVLPMANIPSFGMCMSPANPAVQAATAAASGVFTPAPCVPATAAPWDPPEPVLISEVPAFGQDATCECAWAGTIAVINPGQVTVATGA
jgi:hypothetical protein